MIDPLEINKERSSAADDLIRQADQLEKKVRVGDIVHYSALGTDPGLLHVADRGELIGLVRNSTRTTLFATVLFDGKKEPEYIDARLLMSMATK